jgi:hypothetical protein
MSEVLQRLREARARALAPEATSNQTPVFVLEDAIPQPPPLLGEEPEVEDRPDPRWQPFQWKATARFLKRCSPLAHRPMVGRCALCGDIFPCPGGNCGHLDCADPSVAGLDCPGNGTALPECVSHGVA